MLANYVTQTGDQVLVDKVTYNFRSPQRGEVFIFKTAGIAGLAHERGPNQEGSEDFIKRCVGLAGDLIEVKPPVLYVNSKPAQGADSFQMEFDRSHNYPGYTLINPEQSTGVTEGGTQTYYVPADCYWAMGDNSPNSADSRYLGWRSTSESGRSGLFRFLALYRALGLDQVVPSYGVATVRRRFNIKPWHPESHHSLSCPQSVRPKPAGLHPPCRPPQSRWHCWLSDLGIFAR